MNTKYRHKYKHEKALLVHLTICRDVNKTVFARPKPRPQATRPRSEDSRLRQALGGLEAPQDQDPRTTTLTMCKHVHVDIKWMALYSAMLLSMTLIYVI